MSGAACGALLLSASGSSKCDSLHHDLRAPYDSVAYKVFLGTLCAGWVTLLASNACWLVSPETVRFRNKGWTVIGYVTWMCLICAVLRSCYYAALFVIALLPQTYSVACVEFGFRDSGVGQAQPWLLQLFHDAFFPFSFATTCAVFLYWFELAALLNRNLGRAAHMRFLRTRSRIGLVVTTLVIALAIAVNDALLLVWADPSERTAVGVHGRTLGRGMLGLLAMLFFVTAVATVAGRVALGRVAANDPSLKKSGFLARGCTLLTLVISGLYTYLAAASPRKPPEHMFFVYSVLTGTCELLLTRFLQRTMHLRGDWREQILLFFHHQQQDPLRHRHRRDRHRHRRRRHQKLLQQCERDEAESDDSDGSQGAARDHHDLDTDKSLAVDERDDERERRRKKKKRKKKKKRRHHRPSLLSYDYGSELYSSDALLRIDKAVDTAERIRASMTSPDRAQTTETPVAHVAVEDSVETSATSALQRSDVPASMSEADTVNAEESTCDVDAIARAAAERTRAAIRVGDQAGGRTPSGVAKSVVSSEAEPDTGMYAGADDSDSGSSASSDASGGGFDDESEIGMFEPESEAKPEEGGADEADEDEESQQAPTPHRCRRRLHFTPLSPVGSRDGSWSGPRGWLASVMKGLGASASELGDSRATEGKEEIGALTERLLDHGSGAERGDEAQV